MKRIKYLLKFGERKYLERLVDGKMYFSSAINFRKIEEELFIKGQGDKLEGGSVLYGQRATMTDLSTNETINIPDKFSIPIYYEPADKLPVFCLLACFEDDCINGEGYELDIALSDDIKEDIKNHFPKADSVAIIRNPQEFIQDIHSTIGYECKSDLVNYFHLYGYQTDNGNTNDLEYFKYLAQDTPEVRLEKGKRTVFDAKFVFRSLLCKDVYFSKEQEYRFILTTVNIDEPREFDVKIRSDIELVDISEII